MSSLHPNPIDLTQDDSPNFEMPDAVDFVDTPAQPNSRESNSRSSASSRGLSEGELEEGIMDISRSDAGQAETMPNSISMENEETYEPPADIILPDTEPSDATEAPIVGQSLPEPDQTGYVTNDSPRASAKLPEEEKFLSVDQDATAQIAEVYDKPPETISVSDASDPDDYEPPEPTPSEGKTTLSEVVMADSPDAQLVVADDKLSFTNQAVMPVSPVPDPTDAFTTKPESSEVGIKAAMCCLGKNSSIIRTNQPGLSSSANTSYLMKVL